MASLVSIAVHTASGTTHQLEVQTSATVRQAKECLEEQLNIPWEEQRLVLDATVLDNDLTPFEDLTSESSSSTPSLPSLLLVRVPRISLPEFAEKHHMTLTQSSGVHAVLALAAGQGEGVVCLEAIKHELFEPDDAEERWRLSSALSILAQGGLAEAFQEVVERFGGEPGFLDQGFEVLHLAAKRGLIIHCKVLLQHPSFTRADGKRKGCTALHHAANEAVLRVLLENECLVQAINCLDANGCSCLHYVSSEGACRLILQQPEFDAINAIDRCGQTALHWSRNQGVCAAIANHPSFNSINLADEKGKTALHLAAHSEALVRVLLAAQAEASAVDKGGQIALHFAGSAAVCLALFESGLTDVNAINNTGRTALHTSRNGEVARAILTHSEFDSVGVQDQQGLTAIALAAQEHRGDVVLAILQDGFIEPEAARALAEAGNLDGEVQSRLLEAAGHFVDASQHDDTEETVSLSKRLCRFLSPWHRHTQTVHEALLR